MRYIWGEVFNRWILILPVFSIAWSVTLMFGLWLWPVVFVLYVPTLAVLVCAIVWGIYIGGKAQDLWRFFVSKGIFLRCTMIILAIIMAMVVVLFGGIIAFVFSSTPITVFLLCLQLILGAIIMNRKSGVSVFTSPFVYRYVVITLVSLLFTYAIWGMSFIIGLYFLGTLVVSVTGQSGSESFQELVGSVALAFLVFGVFLSVILFVLVRILVRVFALLWSRTEV